MSASTSKPRFKTSWKSVKTYEPIYTGGKVALSGDGNWLVTTLNEQVLVTETSTGNRIKLLKGDSSAVTTLSITQTPIPTKGGYLLTATRSLAIEIYSLPSLSLHKTISKAHEAPIITSAVDPTGTLFATGASDGVIKVWDGSKGYCTHVFKGHGGVISALVFDIDQSGEGGNGRAKLISGADDCKIRVWDLRTRECLFVLDGHVSVVRGLDVNHNGKLLISGGRDKVVNVWDLELGVLRKTLPVFETIESIGFVKGSPATAEGKGKEKAVNGLPLLYTGGDKGIIRLWDISTGEVVQSVAAQEKVHEIVDVIYTPSQSTLTAIYMDQNIVTRSTANLTVVQQIIGFNDEVIDTAFLSLPSTSEIPTSETHLAVATNSDLIRVYNLSKFNTSLLSGHKDVVLCLDKSPNGEMLISGSKDKTARIWKGDAEGDWNCIAICEGHVESVGAVVHSKKAERSNDGFLVTGSQDRTVKVWDLSTLNDDVGGTEQSLRSLTTLKIHEKDINSLAIAPNNKLLASGSQDKTAKLFSISYSPKTKKEGSSATAVLKLLGTFNGHKRGIWSVKFSTVDQCLITGSGDRTIKLWNLGDFSCIKTFEGHSNSVLRVDFINKGMQMISAASDGLVKVWNVKDEECAATLDGHEEKVWALTIDKEEKLMVSGGADSVITFWEDVTVAEELEKIAKHENTVLQEQDFENYVSIQDYSSAILLALSMDQPRRLLKLFTLVRGSPELPLDSTLSGSISVDKVIQSLQGPELRQMIGYIKDWNTSARTSEIAQGILFTILKFHSAIKILEALEGKKVLINQEEESLDLMEIVESVEGEQKEKKKEKRKEMKATEVLGALIPYTERHFARSDRIMRESFIVEHLLGLMEAYDALD